MIKILLLEDEQEKARLITETLVSVEGVSEENIDPVTAAIDAKRLLKTKQYDLLILDINVPLRRTERVRVGGGLEVLRAIRSRLPGIIAPKFVIGMTAYDDGVESATVDFSNPLWKLIRFDYAPAAWRSQIIEAAKYICELSRPPFRADGTSYHVPLGIVVGLEDVELNSVLEACTTWEQIHIPHDPVRYFKGNFADGNATVDLVVAAAPSMGMPVAGVVATKLIESFRPRYLAMPGICAGVRSKTKIGDIIVPDPCWDWGSGKITSDNDGKQEFLNAPYQLRLDADVRSRCKDLAEDTEFFDFIYNAWTSRKPKHAPVARINALATGGSVIGRKAAMELIRKQHKNLLGVEMEIFAVLTAAAIASQPRPTAIAMKAVCDFGDERKADWAHRYAAYNSAQFLKAYALRHMAA